MSDKTFVGLDITGFENTGKYRPVSRVTLLVDDENVYTAGDDTGLELTASCPHATQEMVNALLAQLQGYQYQSFTADAANLDPSAELGDGVTVNGIYSIISQLDDDGRGFPDISSPGEVALEEEYPAAGPMTQEFNRQLADTRSQITKTAEEIRLEVEKELKGLSASFSVQLDSITSQITGLDGQVSTIQQTVSSITSRVEGLEGEYTELKITLGGVTVTDTSGTTFIKGSSIQTSTLYVQAANITGMLQASQINLTGAITWGDLDSDAQGKVNSASSLASTANDTISDWKYQETTYIDGAKLMTGTVTADNIQGRYVDLLDSSGDVSGTISIEPASTSDEAIRIESDGGMALDAMGGTLYLESKWRIILNPGTEVDCQADFLPGSDNRFAIGYSQLRWTDVYAVNGTIQTSDANQKNSIEPLPDQYITMLDQITPKRYKLNDGQSGRYHVGFIAQDVEAAMASAGISDMEFAGWIKDIDADGNAVYMLRYNEFMAILLAKIKKLEQKLTEMEGAQ